MEHRDVLQTIAEVAATFAGFTGVISVFGRTGDSNEWPLQGARSIIEASLATILFALLPFVIHGFGADSQATWRISSGCFLALVVGGAVGGAMCALLLANLLGFSLGSPATVYLAALLGPLTVAGLTFLQMVVRASRT
jgi:hypothetical protein